MENLHDQGVKMTTHRRRWAVNSSLFGSPWDHDLFEEVPSCETRRRENEPTIYLEAAKTLNVEPSRIAVYEDLLRRAHRKNAGFTWSGCMTSTTTSLNASRI